MYHPFYTTAIMKHIYLSLAIAALTATAAHAQRMQYVSASTPQLPMERIATEQPVTLNRILLAGYNSLCVPYTLSAEQVEAASAGLQVERLAAINQEGSTLCLYFVECTNEGIEAGVPYLVYAPKTTTMHIRSTETMGMSAELRTISMSDARGNSISFGSSWESVKGDGRYGIPAQQDTEVLQSMLVRTSADKTFLPTRCGIMWDTQAAGATDIEIRHAKSLDAITAGIASRSGNGLVDVTDVRGTTVRRGVAANGALNGLPRGIYVVGGVKIAVR